jgi:hypothetical protein
MAKLRGVDAKLQRLGAIGRDKITPSTIPELRDFLADGSSLVVAEAAELAGTHELTDLASDLAAAFDRFMLEDGKTDKGCRAKIAIIEALNKLNYDRPDVFLRGLRHYQEPIFGTKNDTAGPLRGVCAFALVRVNYPAMLMLLADMLLERDLAARTAAVQALGATGMHAALPLLRFKTRIGDEEPGVVAECLSSLIRLDPAETLPFVAEFLHSSLEPVQEGAALALAESRRPEALEILKDFWPHARGRDIAETALLAIALLRLPGSLEFLMQVLDSQDESSALAALDALAIHRHNDAVRERVAAVVARQANPTLKKRFEKKFDSAK